MLNNFRFLHCIYFSVLSLILQRFKRRFFWCLPHSDPPFDLCVVHVMHNPVLHTLDHKYPEVYILALHFFHFPIRRKEERRETDAHSSYNAAAVLVLRFYIIIYTDGQFLILYGDK